MKVLLADPQLLVIESLADALTRRGFAVVALATSPPEVFVQVAERQPDICLLAARFQTCSGLDVFRVIAEQHPHVKVVIVPADPDPGLDPDSGLMAAAFEAGAAGFLARDCHVIDFVRALTRVRRGERVFDGRVLGAVAGGRHPPGAGDGWLRARLTSREQEVLIRIAEGQGTRQISRSLAVTEATVRTHVQNVLVKLGVHSRLEASTMVAESGVLGRLPATRPVHMAGGS